MEISCFESIEMVLEKQHSTLQENGGLKVQDPAELVKEARHELWSVRHARWLTPSGRVGCRLAFLASMNGGRLSR